jgi:lipoic acid synthetase
VLVPDFRGRFESLRAVVEERPDVFNHNVETVPRLYSRVRRGARLDRSLGLLAAAKELVPGLTTKSGFMVGLGETRAEIVGLLRDLRDAAVDVVTIGQYLRPSRENLPVEEYVTPAVFEEYRLAGEAMGFRHVFSGPFVRSSYRAEEALFAAHASGPVIPRPDPSACHSEERSDEESLPEQGRDPSLRSG